MGDAAELLQADRLLAVSLLDRGYQPTPEEAERLRQLHENDPGTALLRRRALAAQGEVANGYVYFIRHGEPRGPIKIGFSKDVSKRLADLQSANPFELTIEGVIPGSAALERELHERFAADHIRGEWFRPSKGLTSFIYWETNWLPHSEEIDDDAFEG